MSKNWRELQRFSRQSCEVSVLDIKNTVFTQQPHRILLWKQPTGSERDKKKCSTRLRPKTEAHIFYVWKCAGGGSTTLWCIYQHTSIVALPKTLTSFRLNRTSLWDCLCLQPGFWAFNHTSLSQNIYWHRWRRAHHQECSRKSLLLFSITLYHSSPAGDRT